MAEEATQNKQSGSERSAPENVVRFLGALFDPHDYVLIRPVESWTQGNRKCSRVIYDCQRWQRPSWLSSERPWQSLLKVSEENRANVFFGVCPRVGPKGQFDLSWQIRTVRALWVDVDHCKVEDALQRCAEAGLPRPSIVVNSGHGAHLDWLLTEPYLIDDVEKPPAVLNSWPAKEPNKPRRPIKYIKGKKGELGVTLYLADGKTPNPECPWVKLSEKARHVQDVLSGQAAKIGGDHTSDLARCLRLPGTLNRKDERNGKQLIPCELVECDPSRRYPFADFEALAAQSPARQRRENVAAILLPAPRKLRAGTRKQDILFRKINTCTAADIGQRSELDWNLICFAIENGIGKEELWGLASGAGKFAERGRDYFDRTWEKAENHTREKIYERNHARGNGASRNGVAPVMPSGPVPPGPDEPDGDGDGDEGDEQDHVLPEEATDPHRLAREWLARRTRHEQPGDSAAYYRESIWRWEGNRWVAIPDREVAAIVNHFVRQIFEEDARLQRQCQEGGEEGERPATMPPVTRKLVTDVMGAIEGLVLVPQSVDQPSWRGPDNPGRRNWIALRNGILDVDALLGGASDVLRPHTPCWFSPTCLPYDFDPAAECPRWRSFLTRNLGDDPGKQRLLQQWAGYLLLHDTSQQHFLVMVGEGANGKSVACEVLIALLGEANVSTEPLELFGDKFRLAGTLGKLANIKAEVGELDKVAEGFLKAFVVGDPMSFEVKYKSAFTARPTARMMLATNNVPHFSDRSDGLWRRMLLLPFAIQIPKAERIPGMTKREYWQASGELPGILNWALAGLADLRQEGRFVIPASCKDAADKVRVESNPARRFLLECYERGSGAVFKAALYKEYAEWCEQHGHRKLADIGFGREVARAFPEVRDGKAVNPQTTARENTYEGIVPKIPTR